LVVRAASARPVMSPMPPRVPRRPGPSFQQRRWSLEGPVASCPPSRLSAGPGRRNEPAGKQQRHHTYCHMMPSTAEDLARNMDFTPGIRDRFNGLARYLRPNGDAADLHRQVLPSDVEGLIPLEHAEALRNEFEQRCCFGDRSNFDLMSSAKWVKMLKECGVVSVPSGDKRKIQGEPCLRAGDADVIFSKALVGGGGRSGRDAKRLDYALFCKGLWLVAAALWPDVDGEQALCELVSRICAGSSVTNPALAEVVQRQEQVGQAAAITVDAKASPLVASNGAAAIDESHRLDSESIRMLEMFRPALEDLFNTICTREGSGADSNRSAGNPGGLLAAVAADEYKTLDSSLGLQGGSDMTGWSCDPAAAAALAAIMEGAQAAADFHESPRGRNSFSGGIGLMPNILESSESEAEEENEDTQEIPEEFTSTMRSAPGANKLTMSSISEVCTERSFMTSSLPLPNRRRLPGSAQRMSLSQLLFMCKGLQIVPELVTRVEVTQLFKRMERMDLRNGLTGGLSIETFMDAVAQMAVKAYSNPPYAEVYSRVQDKIQAFLLAVLPSSSRELHERFLYSRT